MLIGTVLVAGTITLALELSARSEQQMQGRAQADSLANFIQVATQYVIANRAAFESATLTGAGASSLCLVDVPSNGSGPGTLAHSTSLRTCAFDASLLLSKSHWPASLPIDAPQGGRYTAIVRLVTSATSSAVTGSLEMLVVLASSSATVTAEPAAPARARRIAATLNALGATGGYVPAEIGACVADRASSTYEVCGSGWKVSLSSFVSGPQLDAFAAALSH